MPMNGIDDTPDKELTLIICPCLCWRIDGRTACTILTAPKKLVSNWALASPIEISSIAPASSYAALFTKTSIRPASSATAFRHAATESSDRTSRGTISTSGIASALAGLRLVPKILWPFCESNRAVDWPTPDDAPVIKMTFWLDNILPSLQVFSIAASRYSLHRLPTAGSKLCCAHAIRRGAKSLPIEPAFDILHKHHVISFQKGHQGLLQFSFPQLPFIEFCFHRFAGFHIGKSSHEEERVRIVQGEERAYYLHPDLSVRRNRLGSKYLQEFCAAAGPGLVCPHFDDHWCSRPSLGDSNIGAEHATSTTSLSET